jgi:hypothetical protein
MKIVCVLLLLTLMYKFSSSDDKIRSEFRYSLSGIGVGQQKISFLSPLFYMDYSFISSSGKVKETSSKIMSSLFETNIDLSLRTPLNIYYSFGIDYRSSSNYLLRLKDYPNSFPELFLGFGYWLETDFYLKPDNTNNPIYYNLNNMLCFSFYSEKNYQKIKISYEFEMPIVGIYSDSEYSSSLPYFFNEEKASFFRAFEIGSFKKNLQIDNKINLDFKIKIKQSLNTFRVQYSFCGNKFVMNGNIKHNIFHNLKIGYLFNKVGYEHR